MAEAMLFSVATDILKLAGSSTFKQIQLVSGARDELQSLQRTVETIQAVLLDAEKQQWHDHQVKHWLGRLSHVLYEVQDLLDDVATEDLRREVTSGNKKLKEVRVFFSKSNQLARRLKVAKEIQKLREKLDSIKNDKVFLQLEPHPSEPNVAIVRRRPTDSFVLEKEIIGREEDKRKIIELLFDSSSRESVSVVSIVGIGGLGKTALAQLVYNDDKVKDSFQLKMWVCHGNPEIFDVDLIIHEILKSAAKDEFQKDPEIKRNLEGIETISKDQLRRRLHKVLDGKKYLLVLDDLWNEDRLTWLDLQPLLMGGAMGSKILVTTRNQSVVEAINVGAATHFLRGLSEDKSWDLFKKMAFGDGEELLDPRLEEIGRDVAEKCVGVPLAIRAIGSLLYGNKKETEWLRFKEHELSNLKKLDQGIMEVLKLSYDYLPSRLKPCFVYCALFPKDYVFDTQTMIQLWMAQDFIESSDGSESLEETGDSYILDLLHRSFLEVAGHDQTGHLSNVKMHDLMHDLALKVAGDECKMLDLKKDIIGGGIRHASFASQPSSLQKVTSLPEASNLRTFLSLIESRTSKQNLSPREYDGIFSAFRHCRALGLGYSDFRIPPSLGGRLKHLRFLDVSENKSIESLPDSIADLVNLQTLKLDGCWNLTTLPRDLKKLINLRHLLIDGCSRLSHMPCGLNRLSSLHTLSMFVAQKIDHKVPGGVGRVDELAGLNRLSGSIFLRKLEFLQPTPNAGHLREKQFLRSLTLVWSDEQKDDIIQSNELIVWENLRPHPNLFWLSIRSYTGRSPPSWLSSITNLASLSLSKCRGWRYLPLLSELPSLWYLWLDGMYELEFIQEISDKEQCDAARPFFPSLESLRLHSCRKLKGWWGRSQLVIAEGDHQWYDSQSSFPKLVDVVITNYPHLNSLPLFPRVESLELVELSTKLLEQQVMAIPNCLSEGAGVSTFIPLSKLMRLHLDRVVDLEYSLLDTLLCRPSNLESLGLNNCDKLRSFPRDMRFLTRLPEWIDNLSSLQTLEIIECPGLTFLPDGMGRLTSLKKLRITECPTLEKRCQKESGADWEKIKHVSSLSFDLTPWDYLDYR